MSALLQLDLFKNNLGPHPYGTNDFSYGVYRLPVLDAIKKLNIEPNTETDKRWMVYDVDRPTASWDWEEKEAPAPNIVVTNKLNGHAHLFYGLEAPVHWQAASRPGPRHYQAAVDVAMTYKLDADHAYNGRLAKNPLRDDYWKVKIIQDQPYSLEWLSDYVDTSNYTDRRKKLPEIGLGRNCTLFENLRFWAYRKIRTYWNEGYSAYYQAVFEQGLTYNVAFTTPLPATEVKATATSISKYTWKNTTEESYFQWQENRRRKSLENRRANAAAKRQLLMDFIQENPGTTYRTIAKETGIPIATISRLTK